VSGWFAWRTTVARRRGTDTSVLDHALVHEAYDAGHAWGVREGFTRSAEFAEAVATMRRCADAMEDMAAVRMAVEQVDEEEAELPF
jgi:hypothetical protein